VIIVLLNSCSFSNLYSQTLFNHAGAFELSFQGNYFSANTINDINEKSNSYFSVSYLSDNAINKKFTFTIVQYVADFKLKYSITDKLDVFLAMPLRYANLTESIDTSIKIYDSFGDSTITSKKKTIADFTIFEPQYYSVGMDYLIKNSNTYGGINLELRVPKGSHQGTQNNSNYEFLSDGAFEFICGMFTGMRYKKSILETSIKYNYRAEDLSDRLLIHSEYNFSSIENTWIGCFIDYSDCLSSFKNVVPVNPRRETPNETVLAIGAKFGITVIEKFRSDIYYKLNVKSKYSVNYSVAGLSLSFIL
jgi:hypothetical protein